MEAQEILDIKWAIYALMGEVSVEEILTNGPLVAAFADLEGLLKAL